MESRIAQPSDESRVAQPSEESRIAQPSEESRVAQPSGESRIAQPSGESRVAQPRDSATTALLRFISKNSVGSNDYYTHVSMMDPKGTFIVDAKNMESFWTLYCDMVISGESSVGLADKAQPCMMVLVDLDLKVPLEDVMDTTRPLYTDNDIRVICEIYYNAFSRHILHWDPSKNMCCVLEKAPYIKTMGNGTQYYSSGLHLAFPTVSLQRSHHVNYLLPYVKKQLKERGLFARHGIEDSGSLIDKGYVTAPWLLYGSKKNHGSTPYLLTKVLGEDCEPITLETAFKGYQIFNCEGTLIQIQGNVQYYLPRILSIVLWERKACEIRPNLPVVIQPQSSWNDEHRQNRAACHNLTETMKHAEKLLEILSPERSERYADWMDVGWVLYNISEGSEAGLLLWMKFSETCIEKYNEDKCVSEWKVMKCGGKTIGTLNYMAKLDNPLAYKKIIDALAGESIKEGITGSHNHLAKAMKVYWGHEWVCVGSKTPTWYFFENHHWREIDSAVYLSQKISNELLGTMRDKWSSLATELRIMHDNNPSDPNAITIQKTQNDIQKLIVNLGVYNFKRNVMAEAKEVFYDEYFVQKLNANKYLVCFNNGVYDLHEKLFRQGRPEDYISLQMKVNYRTYHGDEPEVVDVRNFFKQLFPDSSIREYMWNVLSEIFKGGNFRKHLYMWIGVGHNGKSVLQNLLDKLLGPYCVKLPTSLLTGKRTQSSSACPELSRAGNGVRWATVVEPGGSERFNVGILKELTGGDSIYSRALFQEGRDIEPLFKLNVICNEAPKIVDGDMAVWNRIKLIPFESTFSLNAPQDPDEQIARKIFPMDLTFNDKIPSMLQPFLWLLLENYKNNGGRYFEPPKIVEMTKSYQIRSDIFNNFENDVLQREVGARVSINDLFCQYRDWYKEVHGHTNGICDRMKLTDVFSHRFGDLDDGHFNGVRFKSVIQSMSIELPMANVSV